MFLRLVIFFALIPLEPSTSFTTPFSSSSTTPPSTPLNLQPPLQSLPSDRRDILRSSLSLILLGGTTAGGLPLSPNLVPPANGMGLFVSREDEPYAPARRATAYSIQDTLPPTMFQLKSSREAAALKGIGNSRGRSCVFLGYHTDRQMVSETRGTMEERGRRGVIERDLRLVADNLLPDIFRPRRRSKGNAIGIKFLPMSTQPILDQLSQSQSVVGGGIIAELCDACEDNPLVTRGDIEGLSPIFNFARNNNVKILALSPEFADIDKVRKSGLQSLDGTSRKKYFLDPAGFQNQLSPPTRSVTSAKTDVMELSPDDLYRKSFRLYADLVMTRKFVPSNGEDSVANFFGERCLEMEACGGGIAGWLEGKEDGFVVVLDSIAGVEYGKAGGVESRVERITNNIRSGKGKNGNGNGNGNGTNGGGNNNNNISISTTSILVNPTAEDSLSLGRQLRLSIGSSPELFAVETRIADYLWFSEMPPINLLSRVMNELK